MTSPTALEFNTRYHIFTRGINRENIFIEERNYCHFMALYSKHVAPIAETYAYCLLGNHFHLFLRIKTKAEIIASFKSLAPNKKKPLPSPGQHIGNLLDAYAKSINFAYHRTGSLFQHPFGRIPVRKRSHSKALLMYIHQNPQHHGFVTDFRDWPFSSYHPLLSHQREFENKSMVLSRFRNERKNNGSEVETLDLGLLEPLVADDFV
jgi:putative transposase